MFEWLMEPEMGAWGGEMKYLMATGEWVDLEDTACLSGISSAFVVDAKHYEDPYAKCRLRGVYAQPYNWNSQFYRFAIYEGGLYYKQAGVAGYDCYQEPVICCP